MLYVIKHCSSDDVIQMPVVLLNLVIRCFMLLF